MLCGFEVGDVRFVAGVAAFGSHPYQLVAREASPVDYQQGETRGRKLVLLNQAAGISGVGCIHTQVFFYVKSSRISFDCFCIQGS